MPVNDIYSTLERKSTADGPLSGGRRASSGLLSVPSSLNILGNGRRGSSGLLGLPSVAELGHYLSGSGSRRGSSSTIGHTGGLMGTLKTPHKRRGSDFSGLQGSNSHSPFQTRLGKLFSRSRSNSLEGEHGDGSLPMVTRDAKGHLVYTKQIVVKLPNGITQVVTADHGESLADIADLVAMENKLTSYRVHLAASKALLNLDTDIGGVHGNEIIITDDSSSQEGDRRLCVVQTLLRREKLYQECLHSIFDVYAEPLRKFSSLSTEDHRVLFFSLEPILSLSTSLILKLSEAIQTWDPGTTPVGTLFSKQFWRHYEEYYLSYSQRRLLLRERRNSDSEFAQFCRLRHGATRLASARHSLDSLLLLPVQRVPDYDVFLSRLLEETDPSHPDYEDLSKAAARVRTMVQEREEEIKHAQNDQKMEAVQDRFPNDDLGLHDLKDKKAKLSNRRRSGAGAVILKSLTRKHVGSEKNSPSATANLPIPDVPDSPCIPQPPTLHGNCQHSNRIYILEGPVQFTTACQTQDRYLFLFNDLLLIGKQRSSNMFKLKHRVRVCEIWLSDCVDQVAETARPTDRSFVLGWPTTNYVATFGTSSLMEAWREKLSSQILEEKEKEEKSCVVKIRYTDPSSNCQLMTKSLNVANDESATSLLRRCIEEFHIVGKEAEDYQLWSSNQSKDDPPYPLFGHEHPFSIRRSHERDWIQDNGSSSAGGDDAKLDMLRGLDLSHFTLQPAKKKPRDLSLDDGKRNKKVKRSPLHIFKKTSKSTPTTPTGKLFGHPLTVVANDDKIPHQIKMLLSILFCDGLFTTGVLRKPGPHKRCQEVIARMDAGEEVDAKELTVPMAASILKEYLKSLPNCVFNSDMYDQWLETNDIADNVQRLNTVKKLVEVLPTCHQSLLCHLMCVLYHVAKAQTGKDQGMDSYALAVCVSQSVLWQPRDSNSAPQSQAVEAGRVNVTIKYIIDNCRSVLGDECLKLFGEPPLEEGKPRQDSSTDSDSMHSLLGLREQQCVSNRDNSSLDSLDRDCYYPDMDASPQLVKSHLSPTNLSRDSGLTLSDTQLYEDGTESEHSSLPPTTVVRRPGHSMGRSFSQQDDTSPKACPDPGKLSSSHDGTLHNTTSILRDKPRGGPVPPPRKAKRRSAGVELEGSLASKAGPVTSTTSTNLRQSASTQSMMDYRRQVRSAYTHKHVSDDSTLGSLDEEYPSELLEDMEQIHTSADMGTIHKSPSGAHLYLTSDTVSSQSGHRPQTFNIQQPDISKAGPRPVRRSDLHRLGGSLDAQAPVPIPENQILSFSAHIPSDYLAKAKPSFTLTPPDSPDIKQEDSIQVTKTVMQGKVDNSSARPLGHKDYSVSVTDGEDRNSPESSISSTSSQGAYSSSSHISEVQMRPKLSSSSSSVDRRAKLMRSDAIDSTVLRRTPVEDSSGEKNLRKGMTASGADKFPKTIPLRTSLYSLDEMVKVEGRLSKSQVNTSQSKGGERCHRSDSYSGMVPANVDNLRQKTIEKSVSDNNLSDQMELSGPVRATGKTRPEKPPSYEEALQRKCQGGSVSSEVITAQQEQSAKAKKLYEESLEKYEVQKDTNSVPKVSSPSRERRGTSPSQSPRQDERRSRKELSLAAKQPPPYEQACQRAAQIREQQQQKKQQVQQQQKQQQSAHVATQQAYTTHISESTKNNRNRRLQTRSCSPPFARKQILSQAPLSERPQQRSITPPASRDFSLREAIMKHELQPVEITSIMDRHQNLLKLALDSPPKDWSGSRRSSLSSREGTPTRSSVEMDRSRHHKKDNKRTASRSRERRPGQRYSDPKMSHTKAEIINISRSKSDSQEHVDKAGRFKQLQAYENKENLSIEDLQKGQRSNRSTPERKPSDEKIKLHIEDRHHHRRSIPESTLKAAALELQKDPSLDSQVQRVKVQSVRNRDWHKELASQYEQSEIFYKPDTNNRMEKSNKAQFGYGNSNSEKSNDKQKRRWTPPVHPTKDLVYITKDDTKGVLQSSGLRPVIRHSSGVGSRTERRSLPIPPVQQSHQMALWSDDMDRSRDQFNSRKSREVSASHRTGSEPKDAISDAQGLNWSVAKLRNNFTDQNKPSSEGSHNNKNKDHHFYVPGSQPPEPVSRQNAPWRSTRTPNEKTNPNADEAYI